MQPISIKKIKTHIARNKIISIFDNDGLDVTNMKKLGLLFLVNSKKF